MTVQSEGLRRFVLREIPQHPEDIIAHAAEAFGVSRQAVSYHLRKLAGEGLVRARGRTSARRYSLARQRTSNTFELSDRLEEHVVWRDFVAPELADVPANARAICGHGVTEMINNAIDHSGGEKVLVSVELTAIEVLLTVSDDGIGIFRRIQDGLDLPGPRDAIQELTKGKFTTDPENHTGEGIFFTSRMFDEFAITANDLTLVHLVEDGDWFIEGWESGKGTTVRMKIDRETTRTTVSVFDAFTSPDQDGSAFDVTHVPVSLAAFGDENLISRSQAKRVLARCNLFRRVVLDFHGVSEIGRAFADEMFRVFPSTHPDVTLTPARANPDVERMIAGVTGVQQAELDLAT